MVRQQRGMVRAWGGRGWGIWALGFASVVSVAGCGGSSATAAAPEAPQSPQPDIARVHKSRCGSCHVRVEPGERTREQLEAALGRHHRRVHLTEEQWQAMIDYLAVK